MRVVVPRRWPALKSSPPVIEIPGADVFSFGQRSEPIFKDIHWTVNEDENWALIASGSTAKASIFQMLLGHLRLSPYPPHGPTPFLEGKDPSKAISLVSFRNRQVAGGVFYDYSARYGAVQEEDKITLRQNMFPETVELIGLPKDVQDIVREKLQHQRHDAPTVDIALFEILVEKMGLTRFLDLPMIALSNGQTRRARILKAILSKPELLLLDEPLTGLDVDSRRVILDVIHSLHVARTPRVLMGLRMQDPIPEWITHIALVDKLRFIADAKDKIVPLIRSHNEAVDARSYLELRSVEYGEAVMEMKNVNVRYGPREILKDISWKIREGERWHLQGSNGSGKTTLLSLVMGDHPQSYIQKHFHLFGKPRSRTPTPILASLIGVLSPEIFDVFPRRVGITVRDVVNTGFDGVFVPPRYGFDSMGGRLEDDEIRARAKAVDSIMLDLWWKSIPVDIKAFGFQDFVDLSIGEQRMVMLMRALVGKKPLILLDEVWSGMDEEMVTTARKYLRGEGLNERQAVVVITHWENEVPWGAKDDLKVIRLQDGKASISAS